VAAPFQHQAENIFGKLGVRIVTGHCFLGGYIGDPRKRDEFVLQKINNGVVMFEHLLPLLLPNPRQLLQQ